MSKGVRSGWDDGPPGPIFPLHGGSLEPEQAQRPTLVPKAGGRPRNEALALESSRRARLSIFGAYQRRKPSRTLATCAALLICPRCTCRSYSGRRGRPGPGPDEVFEGVVPPHGGLREPERVLAGRLDVQERMRVVSSSELIVVDSRSTGPTPLLPVLVLEPVRTRPCPAHPGFPGHRAAASGGWC